MAQTNFILTDIMKTGDHLATEGFIRLNNLPNQKFEMTGEYYTLHQFNLSQFDRKIALLDVKHRNQRLQGNKDFDIECKNRIVKLEKLGFKIIVSCPWESKENFDNSKYFPTGFKNRFLWHGQHSWFWYLMSKKYIKPQLQFDHSIKKYDFLYLNKQPRKHRLKLYEKLLDFNLLEKSLYSFTHHKDHPVKLNPAYELPWLDNTQTYPMYDCDQEIYEKPYNETGLSIVSETNDNCNDVFMTEKIWKPIIAGHIFIVHGNFAYLKKLKKLGFKTFETVFDESYDETFDCDKRIDKIVKLITNLKTSNWHKLYEQTIEIREHNKKTFYNKLNLIPSINNELLRWFEFVDSSQVSSAKS